MSASDAPTVAVVAMQFPTPSETFLSRELRALRERGVQPSVLTIRNAHLLASRLVREQGVENIEVFRPALSFRSVLSAVSVIGVGKVLGLGLASLTDPALPLSIRLRYCAALPGALLCAYRLVRERPDVIHLYWGHYPALVLALIEGLLPDTRRTMFLGAYDLFRAGRISRIASGQCATVFTHARANVSQVQALVDKAPVHVTYRGIDLEGFPVEPADVPPKQPFAIVTVGRLLAAKRFDLVLDAFARIVSIRPEAVLHVIGDGPARADLGNHARRLRIQDNVVFHGRLSEKDVRRHMLAAKAFMLLSQKQGECLPNVAKEAMAAGCVCVSSRSHAIEELIEHAHNGYIVDDPLDYQSVAACLVPHLGVEAIEGIQRNAMLRVRERFDVRRTIEGYLGIWALRT